jgi:plastocyanin
MWDTGRPDHGQRRRHRGDWTGRDSVTVGVGTGSDGSDFAFGPPAMLVATGTELQWSWTGEGTPTTRKPARTNKWTSGRRVLHR